MLGWLVGVLRQSLEKGLKRYGRTTEGPPLYPFYAFRQRRTECEFSLARSAKGLANGTTMSRKQALKLMGAGAATASLALAGCGGKDQANGSDSGSRERSGGSTSDTMVAKGGSTPKQGPDAEKVAAAAKRAMEKYHHEGDFLAKVTWGTGEVATLAMGESMTGVPATEGDALPKRRRGHLLPGHGTAPARRRGQSRSGRYHRVATRRLRLQEGDAAHARQLHLWLPRLRGGEILCRRRHKDPFRAWTTQEQLSYVAGKPLLYEPGTNWSYAHTNFVRLGEALSAITGEPVDELIQSASSSLWACGARRATRRP